MLGTLYNEMQGLINLWHCHSVAVINLMCPSTALCVYGQKMNGFEKELVCTYEKGSETNGQYITLFM